MNPTAKEFFPKHSESFQLSTKQLSPKQAKILQQLIFEWETTPTVNTLLNKWDGRKTETTNMLNTKSEINIMLLNTSSLQLYLPVLFLLLENIPCSIVVLNGTYHNDKVQGFFLNTSNYNVFTHKGTNPFGGVLIAVHRSIPAQRVNVFQNLPNIIVLDIGTPTDKFQLATCYSPPNEKLPISLFDEVLKRNTNTIVLGDLNAKHKAWSNTSENHKGPLLFNWLSTNTLEIINKFVAISTRSNATVDLIVAPTHMLATSASISVLPSIGNDHLPVTWTPAIKIPKSDLYYPVAWTCRHVGY